jgi:hypothetical protein
LKCVYGIYLEASIFRIKDYRRFLKAQNDDGSSLFNFDAPSATTTAAVPTMPTGVDISEFNEFINTYPYTAWKNGIRFHRITYVFMNQIFDRVYISATLPTVYRSIHSSSLSHSAILHRLAPKHTHSNNGDR